MGTQRQTRSTSVAIDFAAEFRNFIADSSNRDMLREIITPALHQDLLALKDELRERDETIDSLKSQLRELHSKDDELEQYTRRNSLRISGIPETPDENCYGKALSLANDQLKLNPPLTLSDIDRTHRAGPRKPGQPRALLVKFATYQQRDRIMSAKRNLHNPQVFINEDLTRKRAVLFWHARQAKREGRIKDAWTRDGRVMIKGLDDRRTQISSINDLDQNPNSARAQTQSGTPIRAH